MVREFTQTFELCFSAPSIFLRHNKRANQKDDQTKQACAVHFHNFRLAVFNRDGQITTEWL